jgi:iron(II)-dependent oxidoreductase
MNSTAFCYIPPGPGWLGSPAEDDLAFDDERPLHQVALAYGYWLGRFPVTVVQFNTVLDGQAFFPQAPAPLRELLDCPVTRVKLREAKAFCSRLQTEWQQQGLLSPGWQVSLPSEAEWEKAARGGLEVPAAPLLKPIQEITVWQPSLTLQANPNPTRRFPWGHQPDPRRANYDQSKLGRPSPVGCFPGGASPYGCEELSGNVQEWTRSHFRPYPYDPHDGREDLDVPPETRRVLRGGGFGDFGRSIRCTVRFSFSEGSGGRSFGFRLALIPEARP